MLKNLFLFLFMVTVAAAQNAATPQFSAWYSFNGNMVEALGQKFAAVNHRALFSADRNSKVNRALEFDGTASYISIDSALTLDSTFSAATLAAWIMPTRFPACLFAKNDIMCVENDFAIFLDSSSVSVQVADTAYRVSLNTALARGAWHHIAVVWDGDSLCCYIDGNFSGGAQCLGALFPLNKGLLIGKNYDATNYLAGKLDDLRICNFALDAAGVAAVVQYADADKFIAVTKPAEGDLLKAGSVYTLSWASNGLTGIKIEYTTDAGSNWLAVADTVSANAGSYSWNVPAEVNSANCIMRLSETGNAALQSVSDHAFSILTISDTLPYYNVKALLEGFYNPFSNKMVPDTVTLSLFTVDTGYHRIDSVRICLDSLGEAHGYFRHSTQGAYYLVVRHRNHIETWSRVPLVFAPGSITKFDFSSGRDSAYGGNLNLSGSRWCIYGGDINQDSCVNIKDMNLAEQDAWNYVSGYVRTDVDGSLFVDVNDLLIVDNSKYLKIKIRKPPLQHAREMQGMSQHTVSNTKD